MARRDQPTPAFTLLVDALRYRGRHPRRGQRGRASCDEDALIKFDSSIIDLAMENPNDKTFLGLPYDWRRPTWTRIKQRLWNAQDHRLFTPKVYGWGFYINFYEVARRLGLKH